jgi:serine/threonine protein kinase
MPVTRSRYALPHFFPTSRQQDEAQNIQQGQSDGTSNVFVLKTYKTKNAEQYYKNEVEGFKRLSSTGGRLDPNMIGFYGSYIQDDSYNVILDFADEGTLEQYFRNPGQPSAEDILPFWRELFNVIKPLVRIHGISPKSSAESPAEMEIFLG